MMIKMTGEVTHHGKNFILLERDGVGYRISIPESAVMGFSGEMTLFTHEVIRENERELFGFRSMEALELFWKLINISGVGPRIAQKIMYVDEVQTVRSRIMVGDLAFLTSISGVGNKIAQKIVLELKGALAEEPVVQTEDQETLDALLSLGYQRRDVELALSRLEANSGSTEDRIRAALKALAV